MNVPRHAVRAMAVVLALNFCAVSFALTTEERLAILWQRADLQLKAGKPDDALSSAKKAIRIAPADAEAWRLLGRVREQRGEYADAENAYRAAVALEQDNEMLLWNLAWVLYRQGKLQQSIPIYRKAIELEPEQTGVYVDLGLALEAAGDLDGAVATFTKALELGGDLYAIPCAHNGLGYAYAGQGKWREARLQIRLAISKAPDDPNYLDSLGAIAALSGDFRNAEQVLRKGLGMANAPECSHAVLAYCLAEQGRIEEARTELALVEQPLSSKPRFRDVDTFLFAAKAYAAMGDKGRAKELFQVFLKHWPTHWFAGYAKAYLRE